MKIVFLGPPGVGKGTIAHKLVKKLKIPQIATGDLLREAVKNKTELGLKAKTYMDSGQLVPDNLVINLLKERIEKDDNKNGFILDGFPRTIPQAEALEKITKIDKVLNLNASATIIIQRLGGRRTCKKCNAIYHIKNIPPKKEGICDLCGGELFLRDDDKPSAIKKRLDVYRKQTEPLINYYSEKELLVDIDAEKEIPKIVEGCIKALE